MKAISIRQPYIDQILSGQKRYEYRNWRTNLRGPVVLCAAKTIEKGYRNYPYQTGVALGIAEIEDVSLNTDSRVPFRFKWHLTNVRRIDPFPVKGGLSLFNLFIK